MKINISIECSDDDEIFTHLSVIRAKIKKELKKLNVAEVAMDFKFSDNNCYGSHEVSVTDL